MEKLIPQLLAIPVILFIAFLYVTGATKWLGRV